MNARTVAGRRLAALAALVVSSLSVNAVELRGFRGIPWGADVDSLGAAVQVSSRDGVQCYKRERENLVYGEAPITEVRFCFHEERLFMVIIDSQLDQKALLAEFQGTYGPPDIRVPTRISWGDYTTRARVEIMAPPAGKPASMRIYSNDFGPREQHASDVAHQR